jgi:hypothetical protein
MAQSGMVLGIPTAKEPDPADQALPIDRLIRSLGKCTWALLVLADPVAEHASEKLRNATLRACLESRLPGTVAVG